MGWKTFKGGKFFHDSPYTLGPWIRNLRTKTKKLTKNSFQKNSNQHFVYPVLRGLLPQPKKYFEQKFFVPKNSFFLLLPPNFFDQILYDQFFFWSKMFLAKKNKDWHIFTRIFFFNLPLPTHRKNVSKKNSDQKSVLPKKNLTIFFEMIFFLTWHFFFNLIFFSTKKLA